MPGQAPADHEKCSSELNSSCSECPRCLGPEVQNMLHRGCCPVTTRSRPALCPKGMLQANTPKGTKCRGLTTIRPVSRPGLDMRPAQGFCAPLQGQTAAHTASGSAWMLATGSWLAHLACKRLQCACSCREHVLPIAVIGQRMRDWLSHQHQSPLQPLTLTCWDFAGYGHADAS